MKIKFFETSTILFIALLSVTCANAQGDFQKGKARHLNGFKLTNLKISGREIRRGGPPRDGIPSIDHPDFAEAYGAGFLSKSDPVLGVEVNGIAKAYPIRILNYHEIVNDDFDGVPVVIAFCPLCGSGMAFSAKIDGQARTFGVSGLLYNSDVLLYDRQTESLWSQIMMQAVAGPDSGKELDFLPTTATTWGNWRAAHPTTLVLTTDTGFQRNYDVTPYQGYETSSSLMFPVNHSNKDYPKKEKVIGIEIAGKFKAYPFSELRKAGEEVQDEFNGQKLVVHFDKKSKTAAITDEDGKELPAVTLFWFAWYAFHPETEVFK